MPPKGIVALADSSSEDSIEVLNKEYKDEKRAWTVIDVNSMASIPFSDVSHAPYETESSYLNSVSMSRQHFSTSGPKRLSRSNGATAGGIHNGFSINSASQQAALKSIGSGEGSMSNHSSSGRNVIKTLIDREVEAATSMSRVEAEASAGSVTSPLADRRRLSRPSADNFFTGMPTPSMGGRRTSGISITEPNPQTSVSGESPFSASTSRSRQSTAPYTGSARRRRRPTMEHKNSAQFAAVNGTKVEGEVQKELPKDDLELSLSANNASNALGLPTMNELPEKQQRRSLTPPSNPNVARRETKSVGGSPSYTKSDKAADKPPSAPSTARHVSGCSSGPEHTTSKSSPPRTGSARQNPAPTSSKAPPAPAPPTTAPGKSQRTTSSVDASASGKGPAAIQQPGATPRPPAGATSTATAGIKTTLPPLPASSSKSVGPAGGSAPSTAKAQAPAAASPAPGKLAPRPPTSSSTVISGKAAATNKNQPLSPPNGPAKEGTTSLPAVQSSTSASGGKAPALNAPPFAPASGMSSAAPSTARTSRLTTPSSGTKADARQAATAGTPLRSAMSPTTNNRQPSLHFAAVNSSGEQPAMKSQRSMRSTTVTIPECEDTIVLEGSFVSAVSDTGTQSSGLRKKSNLQTINEERLVAFVKQVSDPEVLWVIYDYLCESPSKSRYKETIAACKELLDKKEALLAKKSTKKSSFTPRHNVPVAITESVASVSNAGGSDGDGEEDSEEDDDDVDSDDDEFDDFNIRDTPYPYKSDFKYGEPTVSGNITKVFYEGMLYRIKDERGSYYFFNDTLRDVLMVRVVMPVTGEEHFNERAIVTPMPDSDGREVEVTIAVLPEETNFFCSGVDRLPAIMAKAVPMPKDFISPSVTKSMTAVGAEINTVRHAMGKWSKASDQDAFLRCCLKNRFKFTDLNFRPAATSLSRPGVDVVDIHPLAWRRPEDYFYLTEVTEGRLFRGDISCHQVRQGDLRDHTVVAAMAAVALNPAHVMWMFRHPVSLRLGKDERAIGAYRVNLIHNGWWQNTLIDNYLPATLTGPVFSRCVGDPRRLWVSMLEKAYAKSHGSYAAICLIDVLTVMSDFTGFPVRPIDEQWTAAQRDPKGSAAGSFFKYLQRCVRNNYLILIFTPSPHDEKSEATRTLSRKRSSRFILRKEETAVPQFLPGHIYFLTDAAHYQELDIRMVRLRNPWTWETKNSVNPTKKWRHTTWYDQPEQSFSLMNLSIQASHRRRKNKDKGEEDFMKNREGTMWLLWEEALQAFGGGGVCYTSWSHHQYRVRNLFSESGFPQFVLEVSASKKVDGFVTLSLESLEDEVDDEGNVLGTNASALTCGTAMRITRHNKVQKKEMVGFKSCEDIESIAGKTTFVKARDVSMKVSFDSVSSPYYIIPQMEILAEEAKKERRFVISLLLDSHIDNKTLSVSFKKIPDSSEVYKDAPSFSFNSVEACSAAFQCCNHKGFTETEGTFILDRSDTA